MKQPFKVYLAVLNNGWVRRELAYNVIPEIMDCGIAKVIWENPSLTYAHPISANRNKITKRFLATDCDFLLMIDNDVIPYENPLELIYADKDVIGVPAKVRQTGRDLNWVAYVNVDFDDREGYSPLDFSLLDDALDLQKVDIVGTGCILIKRKVLENLKAPFHCEYDEDGITTAGTDFAFCRKAGKAGFEVYTTVQRRCEHVKEVGLNDINAYDDSDYRDTSPAKYNWPWGGKDGFAISQKDWEFIKPIIEAKKPKRILEFGSGLSSLLMSEITNVISYETDPDYVQKVKDAINGNRLKIKLWDGKELKTKHKPFDLVFVDGPRSDTIGRQHSIRYASELSDNIIIHDAGRKEEMMWQNKYLRRKFKIISRSGRHLIRCQYWEKR